MLIISKNDKMGLMDEFQGWLQEQINARGWTASDLAARAGVGPSTITRILTGERNAGPEVCTKIAQALDVDPRKIFRLAGLLPEKKSPEGLSKFQEEFLGWLDQLPRSRQEAVLEIVKGMVISRAKQT